MIALALIALLAFTVEGALGFGGTVIIVCLGAFVVPLDVLLPAFLPINLVLSAALLRPSINLRGASGTAARPASAGLAVAWRVLLVEIAPLVAVGAAVGLVLSHAIASHALLVGFGGVVIALSAFQLAKPVAVPAPPLLVLGGIVHGLFGTGGPMIVYVARTKIADKTAFRATLAVLWIALNTILLVNFAAMHRYPSKLTLAVGAAVVPAYLIGNHLHRALQVHVFERVVWIVLIVAGLALVVR